MSRGEVAAELMRALCDDDSHGYSQPGRWGSGGWVEYDVGGESYRMHAGDYDCSSAVIECWRAALRGTAYEGSLDSATWTGNMEPVFLASGLFEAWATDSTSAAPGDVYLNRANHTAMCVSTCPDLLGEFSLSETGGIDGEVGDQTGLEASVHVYYVPSFGWDVTLHYNGLADVGADSPEAARTEQPSSEHGEATETVAYRVRDGYGWNPEVSGLGDFAGNYGSPIDYLAVSMRGWYQAHTAGGGWLPRVSAYDVRDLDRGCAGDGSPVDGVRA